VERRRERLTFRHWNALWSLDSSHGWDEARRIGSWCVRMKGELGKIRYLRVDDMVSGRHVQTVREWYFYGPLSISRWLTSHGLLLE
jgi:hypothetical protein